MISSNFNKKCTAAFRAQKSYVSVHSQLRETLNKYKHCQCTPWSLSPLAQKKKKKSIKKKNILTYLILKAQW